MVQENCRIRILDTFARWTALSALRSGSPVKSRSVIYPLLRSVDFQAVVFRTTTVSPSEFDAWHQLNVMALSSADTQLNVGWAAKLINVYLKTAAYIGDLGAPPLRDVLHPPLDGGLWRGVARRFRDRVDILTNTHCVTRIAGIDSYDIYRRIIKGLRLVARELGCRLIEVEQLWEGGDNLLPA
jgi:hypothetical protein